MLDYGYFEDHNKALQEYKRIFLSNIFLGLKRLY